jgi:hypothetical protein
MLLQLKKRKVCIITCMIVTNFNCAPTDCLRIFTTDDSRQHGTSQQTVRLTKDYSYSLTIYFSLYFVFILTI